MLRLGRFASTWGLVVRPAAREAPDRGARLATLLLTPPQLR
jgi:hypothetical protein